MNEYEQEFLKVTDTLPTPQEIEEGTRVKTQAYKEACFILKNITRNLLRKNYCFIVDGLREDSETYRLVKLAMNQQGWNVESDKFLPYYLFITPKSESIKA